MTTVDTSDLVELDKDLDDSVACFVQTCDIPAKFVVQCRKCGKAEFICPAHRKQLMMELSMHALRGDSLQCVACGAMGAWRDVLVIVPL